MSGPRGANVEAARLVQVALQGATGFAITWLSALVGALVGFAAVTLALAVLAVHGAPLVWVGGATGVLAGLVTSAVIGQGIGLASGPLRSIAVALLALVTAAGTALSPVLEVDPAPSALGGAALAATLGGAAFLRRRR